MVPTDDGWPRWKANSEREELTDREIRNADLHGRVLAHFHASAGTYGALRVTADLREFDVKVTQKVAALAMREPGIAGISRVCPGFG